MPKRSASALVGVVLLAGCGLGQPSEGPLENSTRLGVEMPLGPGETVTISVIFPPNPLDAPIRIESVAPVEITGAQVVGIAFADPIERTIVNAAGFPPDGWDTQPVEGAMIQPRQEACLLIGLRVDDGIGQGVITGIRVRYAADGQTFETVLHWTLRVGPGYPFASDGNEG